jgi:DNA topoisomerase-1
MKVVPIKSYKRRKPNGGVTIVRRATRKVVGGTSQIDKEGLKEKLAKKRAERQDGKFITSGAAFEKIKKELKIPPAWVDVKINTGKDAALLATGKDAKGRTQYVYSANATMKAAEIKYIRNLTLIKESVRISKTNASNLKSTSKKVSEPASVLDLIQATGIRPGSLRETGAKVQAYGATTLEGRHVTLVGGKVVLKFVGKKGVDLAIPVTDSKLAKTLLARKAKAGKNGKLFSVTDADLRSYVKKLGGDFKPKDFRTLKGTSTAMAEVKKYPRSKNMTEYKKTVMTIAKKVAETLGNTPSIALKSYINPFVFADIKPLP